jgi:hypothetical protein
MTARKREGSCGAIGAGSTALRTPRQGATGAGGANRNAPTGAAA